MVQASKDMSLIVIGEKGAGKTCLSFCYTGKQFDAAQAATAGVGHIKASDRSTTSNPENKFTVNIWDTAGQERFRSIAKAFYNKAQGALICFDLTSQESFREVKNWSNSIAQNCTNTDVATVLVGCKADLEDERVVSQEDAER